MKKLLLSLLFILGLLPLNVSAYTVQKGDTLSKIAIKHSTTVKEIAQKNSISNPNRIYVGQYLNLDNEVVVGGNVYIPPKNNGAVSSTGGIFTNVTTTNLGVENLTINGFTPGSVLFAGNGGLIEEDNSNLFYDNTNNRIGIGTTTPKSSIDNTGFTTLGEIGIPIKMAFFEGTFPSFQGTSSQITLTGIDASKIRGIMVNGMWASGGAFMSNQFRWISSYEYDWYMGNGTNPTLFLTLSNYNSLSMTSKPVYVLVFYTE